MYSYDRKVIKIGLDWAEPVQVTVGNMTTLLTRILDLTVPCTDDGERFVRTHRLDLIRMILASSTYTCRADLPLAKVYQHRDFDIERPFLLISCHIDSLYGHYHSSLSSDEIHGTFDNSICNAVLVEAMVGSRLPVQTLACFTGDEEQNGAGVDQVVKFLTEENANTRVEMAVVMDVTEACHGVCHVTVENVFRNEHDAHRRLKFSNRRELGGFLSGILPMATVVEEGVPDEAWQYDEHDLNCFSLCLPCRVLGSDMHDDRGIAIARDAPETYLQALTILTNELDRQIRSVTP